MEKACSTNNFKLVIAEKVAELWKNYILQPKIQEVPDKKNQNLLENTNS